jgi:hypothetical protein
MQAPEGFQFVDSPDLRQVSQLIGRTWPRPRWNYDLGLLELHLRRPGCDPGLSVGIATSDGALASYEALISFDVELLGERRRAVFASFFTVAPEQQGKGLSIVQEQVLIERAIEKGFEIYLVMCEEGARSNQAVKSVFTGLAIPVSMIRSISYFAVASQVVRSRLPLAPSGRTRLYQPRDRQGLLPLLEGMGKGTDLRKRIPESDVDFVFAERPHSQTYVFEKAAQLRAVANVLSLEVVSANSSVLNFYFENVALGDLSSVEQALFLGDILSAFMEQGFHGAFLPDLGYVPVEPFRRFGFRTAPRKINLYLAPLQPDAVPGRPLAVQTLHLDVY